MKLKTADDLTRLWIFPVPRYLATGLAAHRSLRFGFFAPSHYPRAAN